MNVDCPGAMESILIYEGKIGHYHNMIKHNKAWTMCKINKNVQEIIFLLLTWINSNPNMNT